MTISGDTVLVRLLETRENYDKYVHLVEERAVGVQTRIVLGDMGVWFDAHPNEPAIKWPEFLAWVRTHRQTHWHVHQIEDYERFVNAALGGTAPAGEKILGKLHELAYIHRINDVVNAALRGEDRPALDDIARLVEEYRSKTSTAERTAVVCPSLVEALRSEAVSGLEWRLEDLNRSVGPLRKGDLVVLGARPETGKTSFVCSEFTYMVRQLPDGVNALIVNNEERAAKIVLRLYESATNRSYVELVRDPADAERAYAEALGGHSIDVLHDTAVSIRAIENVLRTGKYGLIAINVFDKVHGFDKLESVERSAALAKWARAMADKYGPVILVAQADYLAEGKRYPTQAQLYGSKTRVQGEADVQLMLGYDQTTPTVRYLAVVKNKSSGGPRVDPALAHLQSEVAFNRLTGRFSSLSFPDTEGSR